jgi:hypothetical protein
VLKVDSSFVSLLRRRIPVVKRTILALLAGVVVGVVLGPAIYYVKTAPQRAAFNSLAREADADLKLVATNTSTQRDYAETVKRSRARKERFKELIAEKVRMRSRARQIAIASGVVTAVVVFGSLFWVSNNRKPNAENKPAPDPSG